jgi:DNA adenine methylase
MAQYPHISPFRYPGGKTWLIPFFHNWASNKPEKSVIVEPFAGGASITLSCLETNICKHAILIELDPNIAAVWKTILGRDWKRLVEKIKNFKPNITSLERELKETSISTFERAWQTILLNRINHGGITAAGSGRLRKGEAGKGIGSRWYPETLVSRIERIRLLRSRIEFVQGDGLKFIKGGSEARSIFFIDPPYPKAGRRLYDCWDVDHAGLFTAMSRLDSPFVATYEKTSEVQKLAQTHRFQIKSTVMFSRLHRTKQELLISNNQLSSRHG